MPARLRDLKRALESLGCVVERPHSGSHWIVRSGGKAYPLPCHNGERSELADVYIRGVCRCFGIDESDLRKKL